MPIFYADGVFRLTPSMDCHVSCHKDVSFLPTFNSHPMTHQQTLSCHTVAKFHLHNISNPKTTRITPTAKRISKFHLL